MRSSSGCFGAAIGAFDLCGVYLSDRLGLYRVLAKGGPMSAAELASVAGIQERYALEWLEQQAASAILDLVDEDPGPQRFVTTVEAYARDAGFARVEVAPIENDFWRFYLLRP